MHTFLRNSVQQKYGSPVNTPRDCNRLSDFIEESTGRSISPTSLRRFFGLLPSNSAISRYNLDTLSIYCGYMDYETISSASDEELELLPLNEGVVATLIAEVNHLSGYTMKRVSRICLTDFESTIPRKELNDKLEHFLHSAYSIFPLIAPGGHGKTVALAHWYRSVSVTSYCLYTAASIFQNMADQKSNTSRNIVLNLGRPGNLYETLLNGIASPERPLVLIIDSVDEISSDKDKLFGLIDYLFDVANTYSENGSLKIVFALRESVWNNYLSRRFERFEANSWFEREAPLLETGYTNLALLTNEEIRSIVEQSNRTSTKPFIFECLPWNLREMARVPINLRFIVEVFRRKGSLENIANLDITRAYVLEFVFKAHYAEEKEDLIREVIRLMNQIGDYSGVLKNDIKKVYPIQLKRETGYFHAYRDLLSSGVFIESREENNFGVYTTKVAFRHHNFFIYLYALYLIEENGGLNFGLISSIAHLRKNEHWIPNLVATLYEIAYENEAIDAISRFCELPEILLESLPVRIAVGTSFRREKRIRNQLIKLFAASPAGRASFFECWVDVNYLFNNYQLRITEYLKHINKDESKLFANCILYLAGFLKMDSQEASRYHAAIEQIQPDSTIYPWPVGRKVAAKIVHTYFIEKRNIDDLKGLIDHYTGIAHSYPGYLGRSLVEFELYILIALALVQKYDLIESVVESILINYGLSFTQTEGESFINRNQNAIPFYFLEYANYKLGRPLQINLSDYYETAISNYTTTFDDFQFLIFLHLFLFDIYTSEGDSERAIGAFDRALELSQLSEYDLFIAILLNNDPLNDPEKRNKAAVMIAASGFNPQLFKLSFGSFSAP